MNTNNNKFEFTDKFVNRHIGPNEHDTKEMLKVIGTESLDTLMTETVPDKIRLKEKLDLPEGLSEHALLELFREYADKNKIFKSTNFF